MFGGLLLFSLALAACVGASPTVTGTVPSPAIISPSPTQADPGDTPVQASPTQPSLTPSVLPPDFWMTMPVIPTEISERVREIHRLGLEKGNSPRVFSRIGDCSSAAPAFLTGFDSDYDLGEYASLQPAVDYFHDSFKRPSFAAKAGLNTAGVLSTLWTDEVCLSGESLLACQYRLDNPAFAIIALGTNDPYYVRRDPGVFERNMRIIIEETIARGIIPILATKADNLEGDNAINATVARLALEYEVPLWNFWLAVQDLPDKGLLETEHLTTISYLHYTDFSMPHSLEYGMQVRNLTALQVLNFLWGELSGSPAPTP